MNERGFSLMEAIVATIIAVLAVMGLAFSFGIGRSDIDRFAVARAADSQAQARMDSLTTLPDNDPARTLGVHAGNPFTFGGRTLGASRWEVTAAPGGIPAAALLQRVTVTVSWSYGGFADSAAYRRLFPRP